MSISLMSVVATACVQLAIGGGVQTANAVQAELTEKEQPALSVEQGAADTVDASDVIRGW